MKLKKDSLWIYISAATAPIILFIVIVLIWMNQSLNYKEYKFAFADSITFAQDNDSLKASFDGVSTKISYHNATSLYRIIAGGGFGMYEKIVPIDSPLLLDFGNGDIMKIWAKDRTTYLILYEKANGSEFFYSTLAISRLVCLERLVTPEWGNSLWEDKNIPTEQ